MVRVDPLDERERKLRGVYGVEVLVAGVNGEKGYCCCLGADRVIL